MNAAPNPLPPTMDVGYHPPDCWREPGHHGCAIRLLDHLLDEDYVAPPSPIPDAPQASLPLESR